MPDAPKKERQYVGTLMGYPCYIDRRCPPNSIVLVNGEVVAGNLPYFNAYGISTLAKMREHGVATEHTSDA